MKTRREYDKAIQVIRSVVAAWDPYCLLEGGAPEDEFDPEVARLAARIKDIRCTNTAAQQISEVFSERFEPSGFDPEACSDPGQQLFLALDSAGLLPPGSDFTDTPPQPLPPPVWCDFNACGWSGAADDDCYYALDAEALNALPAEVGTEVFLFDTENATDVLGRVAKLERFEGLMACAPSWTLVHRPATMVTKDNLESVHDHPPASRPTLREITRSFVLGGIDYAAFREQMSQTIGPLDPLEEAIREFPEDRAREAIAYVTWLGGEFGEDDARIPRNTEWTYGTSTEPFAWVDQQAYRARLRDAFRDVLELG